jgi:hypothetical protein
MTVYKAQKRAACRLILVGYSMRFSLDPFQLDIKILSPSPSPCKLAKDLILFIVKNLQQTAIESCSPNFDIILTFTLR